MARYEVIGLLRPETKTVYRACMVLGQGITKEVVLKRFRAGPGEDASAVLAEEARTLALLRHKNIVEFLELGRDEDGPFIALELVDGMDLARLLRERGRLPPSLALFIVAEVLRALDHAHTFMEEGRHLGVVYGKLSAKNILLSRQGEVKISGFTLGQRGKAEATFQEDVEADLAAAGAILYELTAGGPAPRGTLKPPRAAGVPSRLFELTMRLLVNEEPQPRSARGALEELLAVGGYPADGAERLGAVLRGSASPSPSVPRLRGHVRWLAPTAGLGALVVAASVFAWPLIRGKAKEPAIEADPKAVEHASISSRDASLPVEQQSLDDPPPPDAAPRVPDAAPPLRPDWSDPDLGGLYDEARARAVGEVADPRLVGMTIRFAEAAVNGYSLERIEFAFAPSATGPCFVVEERATGIRSVMTRDACRGPELAPVRCRVGMVFDKARAAGTRDGNERLTYVSLMAEGWLIATGEKGGSWFADPCGEGIIADMNAEAFPTRPSPPYLRGTLDVGLTAAEEMARRTEWSAELVGLVVKLQADRSSSSPRITHVDAYFRPAFAPERCLWTNIDDEAVGAYEGYTDVCPRTPTGHPRCSVGEAVVLVAAKAKGTTGPTELRFERAEGATASTWSLPELGVSVADDCSSP